MGKGAKKGGKKKKSKKSAEDGDDSAPSATHFSGPVDMEEWVTLHLKLVNLRFLNVECRTKVSTPIFVLKAKLFERHGRMSELCIYKESKHPKNLMDDDYKTLDDYGIRGALKTATPVVATLFYDFIPYEHDEPLLLTGCDTPLHDPPSAEDLDFLESRPIPLL